MQVQGVPEAENYLELQRSIQNLVVILLHNHPTVDTNGKCEDED